ncbi:unnamed protein product [Blepharisma stoltei]|uniref:EF-hand domain-containing protein n=1 Tax=Blepharisma stoltei TaxID=1481888 RepID=A0AAU9INH7_9CILI|nr:unnamed protein product [Blepharisma stoltei]
MRRKTTRNTEPKRKEYLDFSTYVNSLKSTPSTTKNNRHPGLSLNNSPISQERQRTSGTRTPHTTKHRSSHPSLMLSEIRSTEINPPDDPKFKNFIQDEANKRLFRGSRGEIFLSLLNPISRFDSVENAEKFFNLENELENVDNEKFKEFTESLFYLKKLKFDLELTFQMTRAKDLGKEIEKLPVGLYYQLEDELHQLTNVDAKRILKIPSSEIVEKLNRYTVFVRETIRAVRSKGALDEAIIFEMLWRVVLKAFDLSLRIHDYTITDAVEMMKLKIRDYIEKHRKETETLQNDLKRKDASYLEYIKNLKKTIDDMKEEIKTLKQASLDKDIKIVELTEIDNRFDIIKGVGKMLKKLDSVITETVDENEKQAVTLNTISGMMEIAKHIDSKKPSKEKDTQTDWCFIQNKLGIQEQSYPQLSIHPFYDIIKEGPCALNEEDIKNIFYEALQSYKGAEKFPNFFLSKIVPRFFSKEELGVGLYNICKKVKELKNNNVHWAVVAEKMLSLSYMLPFQIENFISKLISQFLDLKIPNGPIYQAPFQALQQNLEKLAIRDQELAEFIMTNINISAPFADKNTLNDEELKINSILIRFVYSLSQSKKNYKSIIDSVDIDKSGQINFESFTILIREKCGFSLSDENLHLFWKYFNPENKEFIDKKFFIYDLKFNENLEKSKSCVVFIEDFVLLILTEFEKRYNEIKENYEELENVSTYQEYYSILNQLRPDLNEEVIMNSYTDFLITSSLGYIIDKYKLLQLKIPQVEFRRSSTIISGRRRTLFK